MRELLSFLRIAHEHEHNQDKNVANVLYLATFFMIPDVLISLGLVIGKIISLA